MFNASLVLMLPKLEDKSGLTKAILGDWQFTTIVQAATGYPITVNSGTVPGLSGNGYASGTGQNDGNLSRPNVVEGVDCKLGGDNPTQWLNPAAWTFNGYQIGTNGNSGRNTCSGPSLFQVDASVYKNFKLTSSGRVKLQLRFEVFNLFNRDNFIANNTYQYQPQNVVFNTASGNTATQIISATPAGNFGQLTNVRDPRTAQVGIRLMF